MLTFPKIVEFFEIQHRIEYLPGDENALHISLTPFGEKYYIPKNYNNDNFSFSKKGKKKI